MVTAKLIGNVWAVIVTTGSSARRMLGDDGIQVDAVVVGIIDEDCEFI